MTIDFTLEQMIIKYVLINLLEFRMVFKSGNWSTIPYNIITQGRFDSKKI